MTRYAREGEETDRMLVLGFDAGCGTCAAEIARRVEEWVGDGLAVRNLGDPELMGWREEALGKDAPWAPTLFEVEGGKVRAWTGKRMALPLSRKLGAVRTWRVMEALGEVAAVSEVQSTSAAGKLPVKAAEAVAGMSRGQFLKGVGGAAVAMTVLSGAGSLAPAASAATRNPHDIVKAWLPTGADASDCIRRARLNADARFVAGGALGNITAKPIVVRMRLRNGTIMTSVVFELALAKQYLGVTVSTKPVGRRATSFANLWLADGTRMHDEKRPAFGPKVLYKASAGQRPVAFAKSARSYADDSRLVAGSATRSGSSCPPISSGKTGSGCYRELTRCVKYDQGCESTTLNLTADCWTLLAGVALVVPITLGLAGAVLVPGALACLGATTYAVQPSTCCTVTETCHVPC